MPTFNQNSCFWKQAGLKRGELQPVRNLCISVIFNWIIQLAVPCFVKESTEKKDVCVEEIIVAYLKDVCIFVQSNNVNVNHSDVWALVCRLSIIHANVIGGWSNIAELVFFKTTNSKAYSELMLSLDVKDRFQIGMRKPDSWWFWSVIF